MSKLRPCRLLLPAFVLLGTLSSAVYGQTKQVKLEPVVATDAMKGVDLYHEFCAVCHGQDGRGNGPAASALKTPASDLTLIARQNNGKFPAIEIRRAIDGDDGVPAHGSKDMPMWGDALKSISSSASVAQIRVNLLIDYLKTIQR